MSIVAKLDPAFVRTIVGEFPDGQSWEALKCARLIESKRATEAGTRDWTPLRHCERKGGVYAFLFPGYLFSTSRRIALHAPQKNKARQIIHFEFSSHPELLLTDGSMVAYVGRSANLLDRIRGHFSLGKKSTLAQVQYGLANSRTCSGRASAVRFMVDHATLAYSVLEGPVNVANRDVIEVALWAKYMAPFNIKSER